MSKKNNFDFSGYATKNNVKCGDGRVILKDAFKDNDGMTVPLVWQHMHNEPANVLGHTLLENREDGVYTYSTFNDTEAGKNAKLLVQHGDIVALSIYANNLIEKSKVVAHGVIREVSLVLSGANPGALIDNIVMSHGDGSTTEIEDEAIIYSGEQLVLPELEPVKEPVKEPVIKHADDSGGDETVKEVFETLSEKQKTAVYAIISEIVDSEDSEEDLEQSGLDTKGDGKIMKQNIFEGNGVKDNRPHLTPEQFQTIVNDAKKTGSFKEAFLAHAGTYGIDNINYLFPDAKAVGDPEFVMRDMAWVSAVMGGTRKSRFSRIKSLSADITVESARALGYQLGDLKVEEVFALAKRETTPQTIYKKQKLDRDDIVDITDMDVVSWLKAEMRIMLNEEIARAILIGDGRLVTDDYKIDETKIRPIWTDAAFYTYRHQLAFAATTADIIDSFVASRQFYEGSGSPEAFVAPGLLTSMLLVKDTTGRRIYNTEAELAAALRVSRINEVPLMTGLFVDATPDQNLRAIVVNMRDYNVGADRGGEVNFFDDFDIDYNQYKYLLETRMSGALVKYRSAIVIEQAAA